MVEFSHLHWGFLHHYINIYHPRKTHGNTSPGGGGARSHQDTSSKGLVWRQSLPQRHGPWPWRHDGRCVDVLRMVNQQWAMTRAILAILLEGSLHGKKIFKQMHNGSPFRLHRKRDSALKCLGWTGRVFMFSHFGGFQHEVFAEACMVWQPICFSHFRFFEHGTDVDLNILLKIAIL